MTAVEVHTLRVFVVYNTVVSYRQQADSKRTGLLIISSSISDDSRIMNDENVVCSSLLYLSSGLT